MPPVRVIVALGLLAVSACGEGEPRILATSCSAFANRTDLGGTGVVSGRAVYRKPVIDTTGRTGAVVPTPIRFARVEVATCSTGAVLGAGETDTNGDYMIPYANPGPAGVYARVLSAAPRYHVSVKHSPAQPSYYGVATAAIDDAGDGDSVSLPLLQAAGDTTAGAFNILSQGVRGAEFLETNASAVVSRDLVWYWFPGMDEGTGYTPGETAITVSGVTNDPDQFDDAVLLHEYGHYVADIYSKDDSPGGPHQIGDSTLDLRLAWSEGWATFFSSAVRNDPVQIDTAAGGVRLQFEIEGPSFGSSTRYDSNEVAVAAVLWDAYDAVNGDEAGGPLTVRFDQIWTVMTSLTAANIVSFEDFWVNWQAQNPGNLTAIMALRSMDLWADQAESAGNDDVAGRAKPISLDEVQSHTLYPAAANPDVDFLLFTPSSAGSYTVGTSRCVSGATGCDVRVSNGADTLLDLSTQTGDLPDGLLADNVVGRNGIPGQPYPSCSATCPPNDARTLSSRITFSATAGTPYLIKVTRSPLAPPSAGEFGSYDIVVTAGP